MSEREMNEDVDDSGGEPGEIMETEEDGAALQGAVNPLAATPEISGGRSGPGTERDNRRKCRSWPDSSGRSASAGARPLTTGGNP